MAILVTGAAGFIGSHVAAALARRGEVVVAVDAMTPYYNIGLKQARVAELVAPHGIDVAELDVAKPGALDAFMAGKGIRTIVHLAAQPGVRRSFEIPHAYVDANVHGHVAVLEAARRHDVRHVVYASSSSVYGGNEKTPFSTDDRVDDPRSLYAATKRAAELISVAYASAFGFLQTGLRFFTVYGPWGRPDMAPWLFTDAILSGQTIRLFNHGRMKRDFTFIDDIVAGVLGAVDRTEATGGRHALYNLGHNEPHALLDFVAMLERLTGVSARTELVDKPIGEVEATWADISRAEADLGYRPQTSLEQGLGQWVDWFRTRAGALHA